jgi:hypothetical protein
MSVASNYTSNITPFGNVGASFTGTTPSTPITDATQTVLFAPSFPSGGWMGSFQVAISGGFTTDISLLTLSIDKDGAPYVVSQYLLGTVLQNGDPFIINLPFNVSSGSPIELEFSLTIDYTGSPITVPASGGVLRFTKVF